MQVIITLRKDIESREQGEQVYAVVKQKLADQPDIKVSGHVSNHFVDDEE